MGEQKTKQSKYYNGSRKNMTAFLPSQPHRVLEIGCGDGSFRENLPEEVEYWGVEPVGAAAELAAGNAYRVLTGLYDEVADVLPNQYFDLVVCNDVIEHMPDHDRFLRNIKQKMRPGACIVGSVPNVRHFRVLKALLFRRDWQYQDSGVLDRTHLRFFTQKSLKDCFKANGYQIECLEGINSTKPRLFPPNRLFRELVFLLLGQDTRYRQFAFRIKPGGQGQANVLSLAS
jgi:2-polyprenyl-3-methyl-5-hydroxy-6-metoxy-1,4-benzoquinol methylase